MAKPQPTVIYSNAISGAPAAVGPYSVAAAAHGFLFCSGQIGLDPLKGTIVDGGIEAQTRQVLSNITHVLHHHGQSFSDVVKTTIFLTDLTHFQLVNGLYSESFGEAKPARSTVQVAGLPLGALVEIEIVVALSGTDTHS